MCSELVTTVERSVATSCRIGKLNSISIALNGERGRVSNWGQEGFSFPLSEADGIAAALVAAAAKHRQALAEAGS